MSEPQRIIDFSDVLSNACIIVAASVEPYGMRNITQYDVQQSLTEVLQGISDVMATNGIEIVYGETKDE